MAKYNNITKAKRMVDNKVVESKEFPLAEYIDRVEVAKEVGTLYSRIEKAKTKMEAALNALNMAYESVGEFTPLRNEWLNDQRVIKAADKAWNKALVLVENVATTMNNESGYPMGDIVEEVIWDADNAREDAMMDFEDTEYTDAYRKAHLEEFRIYKGCKKSKGGYSRGVCKRGKKRSRRR